MICRLFFFFRLAAPLRSLHLWPQLDIGPWIPVDHGSMAMAMARSTVTSFFSLICSYRSEREQVSWESQWAFSRRCYKVLYERTSSSSCSAMHGNSRSR